MIDNVLNNEKSNKEEERSPGRISIKEKLAEKKAMIEHCDKGKNYRRIRMRKRNPIERYNNS